jgi:hypothetical protein
VTFQHLQLTTFQLRPGKESSPVDHGWVFVRIDEGFAYWMGSESGVDLATGSVLVLPPGFVNARDAALAFTSTRCPAF